MYLLLFLEGILTFISPCLLPLLSLYIAYITGSGPQGKTRQLGQVLSFILGFSLIFVSLGLFTRHLAGLLVSNRLSLNRVLGLLVLVLALDTWLANPLMSRLSGALPQLGPPKGQPFVFGMIFALAWTPCVGTFLATALTMAASSASMWQSSLMLVTYCLGLGLPFILFSLFIDEMQTRLTWFKEHGDLVRRGSALVLLAMGLLMMSGHLSQVLIALG
ncbi:cytochrome c biogenesis CcdA family protein [Hutsoniella sourekii]